MSSSCNNIRKKQNRDSGFKEKIEAQRRKLLNLERQWREQKEKLEKMEEEARRVKFRYVMGGTNVMKRAKIPSIIAEVQNDSSIHALTEYIQNSQSSATDATLTIRLSTDSINVRGCIFRDYFHMQPRMEICAQFRDDGKYVSEQQLIKECEEKEFILDKNYNAPYEGKRGFNASEIQTRINSCFQQDREWVNILKEMRLEKFIDVFEKHGYVSESIFTGLTENDLKSIGFKKGHIRKWFKRFPRDEPERENERKNVVNEMSSFTGTSIDGENLGFACLLIICSAICFIIAYCPKFDVHNELNLTLALILLIMIGYFWKIQRE